MKPFLLRKDLARRLELRSVLKAVGVSHSTSVRFRGVHVLEAGLGFKGSAFSVSVSGLKLQGT